MVIYFLFSEVLKVCCNRTPTLVHEGKNILLFLLQFNHSVMSDYLQPHGSQARLASLSVTNSWSLLKLMSIKLVMPSNHFILCRPHLLPSVFPSIRVFSSELALHSRPGYWSFSFSISPSNEYWGLMNFRIDWFDLLAVQGILRRFLQHHSTKAWILWHLAFFMA